MWVPVRAGFDPLRLGVDPERLKWFREAELTNGRWAMAAVAGVLFTELVRSQMQASAASALKTCVSMTGCPGQARAPKRSTVAMS